MQPCRRVAGAAAGDPERPAGLRPDVAKSREKARAIMAAKGYGPTKRLKLKVSTRNLPTYRDARCS